MRAAFYAKKGSTGNIQTGDFPDPVCGPRDVIIRVRAAALNGFDPQILLGTTDLKTPMPMIPLGDCAGEVIEVGSDVGRDDPAHPPALPTGFERRRWAVGDRVSPFPMVLQEGMTGETRLGTAAEYARFPAENLLPIPDEVSWEQAAALPIAYGTAYRMLRVRERVRRGQTVLIFGATGGVGVCAVQLAKLAGATVIACGSSNWKLAKLKAIGADHVIDTSVEDVVARCHEIAGKPRLFTSRGVDVTVNYIGGETWGQSLRVTKSDGAIITCGATAGHMAATDLRYVWSYEQRIIGSNGWFPLDQLELLNMVARGQLEPVIHDVRPLDQVGAAIQDLIDRKIFGKVIIEP